jgi:acetyl esterase/lipase
MPPGCTDAMGASRGTRGKLRWPNLIAIGSLPLLLAAACAAGQSQPRTPTRTPPQTLVLWPGGAPRSALRAGEPEKLRLNERGEHIVSNVHAPSITVFAPARPSASHTGLIVVPGGGHAELWMDHEGYAVAAFLADHGVTAFVLKYRLAREPGSTYTIEGDELADVQRAIRLVRSRAAEWQLDPQHIGVIGFSAGGELAALSGAHYDDGAAQAADPIERMSSRPTFQALLYPSIPPGLTFSPDTPPAFLLCGAADDPKISQGLAQLYVALRRAGAHAELHIYDGVGHGFGIRPGAAGPAAEWPQRFLEWLQQQGLADRI